MIFLSTRGSKPKTGLDAFLHPTKINTNALYIPATLPHFNLNLKDTNEDIFVKLFHLFCNDFLKKEELSQIYKNSISQFQNNKFYNIKDTQQGKFLELTNGKSFYFEDIPFVIIKEILKVISKRDKKEIKIINVGNIESHISIINNFQDTDFKICSIFDNQDLNSFQNYCILKNKNPNIATAKIKIDNFESIQNGIYHQSYLNDYYNFTAINSYNFFYILSFVFIFAILYKELNGNLFSLAVPSENLSIATAALIAKMLGIEIKKCNIAFYKNSFLHFILETGKMNKEPQRNLDKWFESFRTHQYPINIERILFLYYDFDSSSVVRAMESFESYNTYTINKTIVNKMVDLFDNTLIENSFDVLNQIGNFARNYNTYIEQNTSICSLAAENLREGLRANEIALSLSPAHREASVEILKDILGFHIKSDKEWNQSNFSSDPPPVTEINDDVTEVARFISNFFG